MSDLTWMEQRQFEKLFGMGGGYVLNFTNTTFADFVRALVNRNIYDDKYAHGNSDSKANQLRGFWKAESNHNVAKLLTAMLDYQASEDLVHDDDLPLRAACAKTSERLQSAKSVAEIDALTQIGAEHDFEDVARLAREAIDKNEPVHGLDRLHTFAMKFLRALCAKHGVATDKSKPLHSIFGEYVRKLHETGELESKMAAGILKSMKEPFEAFNHVRNDQSLAHDNTLLNHDESLFIFNHVTSCLRFLRDLEQRIERKEQARKAAEAPAAKAADLDDEIPF